HRHQMLDGGEPLDRAAGDALRGGIGRDELGVFGFQLLELVQQIVEFLVGDLRSVVNVVPLLVVPDRLAELLQTLFGRWRGHYSNSRATSTNASYARRPKRTNRTRCRTDADGANARTAPIMICAHASSENPPTPVPNAGNA